MNYVDTKKQHKGMLGVCAVHPKGESDDYDGLYFRDNEMQALANDLRDKPLLVEHDSKPVGRVLHAYKNDVDKRLYAVFETNTDTFGGCLAGSMLKHGLVGEVSLGHNCQIESSDNGDMKVIGKNAVELSLVEKGARPETKIYGKTTIEDKKRYINNSKTDDQQLKMTDATETTKPQIPQTVTDASSPDMVKQLLEQVKALTEKQAKMDAENEQLRTSNAQFAEKVEQAEAVGKRKREQAIDGSIKEYFQTLMSKYEDTLKPHETEIDSMLERMKGNSASEPLVQALACAAAAAKGSVTELEKAYQTNKRLKTEIDAKDELLKNQSTQAFAKPAERVVKEVKADASASAVAPAIDNIFSRPSSRGHLKGAGMRERDPAMFKQLMQSAPMGKGLPKLDEFMSLFKK